MLGTDTCELTYEELVYSGKEISPDDGSGPMEARLGRTPYIETDGEIGLTDGDTRLSVGARVHIGVIVNIDVCIVW